MSPVRHGSAAPSRIFLQSVLLSVGMLAFGASIAAIDDFPHGLPPMTVTSPPADVAPRFFSVAQSPDGLLFVGGERGVHIHNGQDWTTTRLPNRNLVRTLVHDGDRRLYVGGYGQFGFIEMDAAGRPVYTDLTPPPDRIDDADNLADIWDIDITPDGVFFRALYHVFRYRPTTGEIGTWHHPGRFGGMLWHEGELLLQFRGEGLRRLDDGAFVPMPGSESLKKHVVDFLPLPEGGLLTVARDGRWQRFFEGELQPWPAPDSLPGAEQFDAVLVRPDGSFILGGPDGRLHVLDPVRRTHRWFPVADGFISDLAPAADGGILIQTDRFTTHLFWPSAWTRLAARSGLIGRVEAVMPWQGEWLAITNSGVLRTDAAGERFEPTGWTSFETWDWLPLSDDRALLADSFNLLDIRPGQAPAVLWNDLYPRMLHRSVYDPDVIHVGTERGLVALRRTEGKWRLAFKQAGFTGLVNSLVELDPHELLLAVDGTGMVRVRYSDEFDELVDWQVFDAVHGIDYGTVPEVQAARLDGDSIVASTRAGFFRWTGDGFEATDLDGLAEQATPGETYQLQRAPDGSTWVSGRQQLWHRIPGGEWQHENFPVLQPRMINSLSFTPDGRVLLGELAAILQYEPDLQPLADRPMSVVLRKAMLTEADGSTRPLPLDGRDLVLPHDVASIRFEYALPSYRRPELNRYRARMLGYEEQFSEWGTITRITYSLLRPGEKRFEVQARDSQGRLSATAPFEFRVEPPWYGTPLARVAWVVLALGLLALLFYAAIRWRLARLTAERERLAEMVEQRTAELAAANRKLRNMANVDGLTGVANRRRLDEYLEEAWARCAERNCELALVLVDVDHFKTYNDCHGHQAGDEALRDVAGRLTTALRRNEDVVARYGGEEFMAVLPAAGQAQALEVAESLRSAIESGPLGITASLGVAVGRPGSGDEDVPALIERADRALYQAKQSGRNRVEFDPGN